MNTYITGRPKKRSALRIRLGKSYYRLKRHVLWLSGTYHFSRIQQQENLPFVCTTHKTILLRNLKDVDLYLQYNKIENLRIAVPTMDGILIRPGETFSYWKRIGKPTAKKGYKEGMVLFCGSFHPEVGGGLCQLSNLIYWMALHTELTVTERYRHSYDVFPDSNRTQPFGSGATCVYNYRDLMLTNDTAHTYQIRLKVTDTHLLGEIRSDVKPLETYQIYEKEHYFQREIFGAYSRNNSIYRKVFDQEGKELADEFITENHALMMYEPYLEEKKDEKE